ncbi:MAG: DEAD/DEAH box helicase [Cenarchaeum symbiont of Oopsacas minuta]|nr:DEAD/DEAH box helicase [Cenarchaeum symbiont of Oopsacas minuta]
MTPSELNEIELVELPAHKVFKELGYEVFDGKDVHSERDSYNDVILDSRLNNKIHNLNPNLPEIVYEHAINKVKSLSNPTTIENNREFHNMLLAGVRVAYQQDGKTVHTVIQLIDFKNPQNNNFAVIRQFVVNQHKERRLDHVIFVNGLPLILLEYKDPTNPAVSIIDAYNQLGNTNYQRYIPKIFNYNTFLIISDRTFAKYGTMTALFERFTDWNDPEDPDKTIVNRLDLMQKHMLNKKSLLEIIQNYIEYESDGRKTIKKIAMQHQYTGVKKAVEKTIDVFKQNDENRIGVIWHTTGSGKSLTMIFYVNIISQINEFENPTFVIITDRTNLDEQLNHFFNVAGFPYPKPKTAILEADSIMDLREKLSTPAGKIIFTTIQKFQQTQNERDGMEMYPIISKRRNIIIIADEAHRSQYKKIAQNLHRALPNALKIGFTGTPIEKEDKSTTQVFGNILSSYKISDAVRDNATVEIVCQSRLVRLHLINKMIGSEFDKITKDLDSDAIDHLSKKWSELRTMLEDPDRLNVIAKDLVYHYVKKSKTFKGKAMLAASTKLAAARYADIISKISGAPKCTCIISGTSQGIMDNTSEEKKTREQMVSRHYKSKQEIDDLIKQFKDEKDDLRLLIVCDMYLTGFDAPIVHTMYVDKPLRDHNLIQAISRVNRIWKDKPKGIIIDYIGITDDLKRAFRSYNDSDIKGAMIPTEEIIMYMKNKHLELTSFFTVDIGSDKTYKERRQASYLDNAITEILDDVNVRKKFIQNVVELTKAYAVCTPHPACQEIEGDLRFFQLMRRMMINSIVGITYISPEKESAIQDLVEESISADDNIRLYDIKYDDKSVDLNKEYIEKIKQIPQENLKMELAYKLLDDAIKSRFKRNMVKQKSFQDRIEETLSKYHGKFESFDTLFPQFEQVGKEIMNETLREEKLQLTDEEIAFFDIISMGKTYVEHDAKIKQIAMEITQRIKKKTTIDWTNQDNIQSAIREDVTLVLFKFDYPPEDVKKLMPKIMQQAKINYENVEYDV